MAFEIYERDPKLGPPSNEEEAAYYTVADAARLRERVARAFLDGTPWEEELKLQLPGGRERFVVARGSGQRDPDGCVRRLVGTVQDLTERMQAARMLEARVRLLKLADQSIQTLAVRVLDIVGEQTESPIGFFHLVDPEQQSLSLLAWSTRTLREFCKAQGAGMHYPIAKAGVWADAVRQRRAVVHNDYASLGHRKGFPAGHAVVLRELVVPILRGGRVVAILGVGNKPFDYKPNDVSVVQYLADLAWDVVEQRRSTAAKAALLEATHAVVKEPDLTAALKTIFACCRPVLGATAGFVSLLDAEGGHHRALLAEPASASAPGALESPRRVQGLLEQALEAPRPTIRNDVVAAESEAVMPAGHASATSLLLAPLRIAGKAIGMLAFANKPSGFTDADARLVEAFAELASITAERARTAAVILASEQRLRAILEGVADGIVLADLETGRLESANSAFRDMFGYGVSEIGGLAMRDLHPEDEQLNARAALERHLREPHPRPAQLPVKRKDGSTFFADVTGTAVRIAERGYLVCCFVDVTEKRNLQASVAQSDRLASMGLLAAGVAHEINNPLSYILYNLEALAEDVPQLAAVALRCRAALDGRAGREVRARSRTSPRSSTPRPTSASPPSSAMPSVASVESRRSRAGSGPSRAPSRSR